MTTLSYASMMPAIACPGPGYLQPDDMPDTDAPTQEAQDFASLCESDTGDPTEREFPFHRALISLGNREQLYGEPSEEEKDEILYAEYLQQLACIEAAYDAQIRGWEARGYA